jgi:plastocyanin
MRRLLGTFLLVLPLIAASVAACSDDDAQKPAAGDGGGGDAAADGGGNSKDGGHSGHDSAVVDSGPLPIRCTDDELAALDLTDGGTLEITFELVANPKQYVNRCATVKAGSSVTFRGSFLQHPLEAAGGDSPNPIPTVDENQPDNSLVVTFPTPGTFGFQCVFHPSLMFGAIRVVP